MVGWSASPKLDFQEMHSLQRRKNRVWNRATRDLTRAIDQARGVGTLEKKVWLLTPNRQRDRDR